MIIVNAGIIRIVAIMISYIVNLTILNMVLKDTAGQYYLLFAWSSFFTVILVGGFSRYIVRELGKNSNLEQSLRKSAYNYIKWVFISATPIVFIAANIKLEIAILASTIPFVVYLAIENAFLRGKGAYISGNIEGQIIRPIILLVILYLALFFIDDITIVELISFYGFGIIVSSIIWFVIFSQSPVSNTKKSYTFDNKSLGNLTTISLAEVAFLQLDIIILGFLMSSEDIAEYKVALLIRMALLVPQQAVLMVLPYFLSKSSGAEYQLYLRAINLAIGFFGVIGNFVLGEELIVRALGASYSNVSAYLYPYFLMMICLGIIGPTSELLIADRKDRIVRKAGIISITLNSILLVFTVPVYGVPAAIAAGATSYVVFYYICYYYKSRNRST